MKVIGLFAAIAAGLTGWSQLRHDEVLIPPPIDTKQLRRREPMYIFADRGLRTVELVSDLAKYSADYLGISPGLHEIYCGLNHGIETAGVWPLQSQVDGVRSSLIEMDTFRSVANEASVAMAALRERATLLTTGFLESYPEHQAKIGHCDPCFLVLMFVVALAVFLRELWFVVIAVLQIWRWILFGAPAGKKREQNVIKEK